jgi:hypothetical protein
MGKPEEKRPLGRPRRRCVDTIKMDLREIVWDGRDSIELAQDKDQWRGSLNCWEFLELLHNMQLLRKGSAP